MFADQLTGGINPKTNNTNNNTKHTCVYFVPVINVIPRYPPFHNAMNSLDMRKTTIIILLN